MKVWKRYFPPVRLAWIFLVVLVWNGKGFVNWAVAWPLILLPLVAAGVDLGFQFARYPKLRIPDAAIANGLFLTVILWPTEVSLVLVSVAIGTVGLRHLLRSGGHPVLNPAAAGVTIAAVLFALPQPWHVGTTLSDVMLVVLFGVILWTRAWRTWRIFGPYFAANTVTTVAIAYYLGAASALPYIVQYGLLGAAPIFYGLFMVTEPRTAPSSPRGMILFGTVVGASAALLPSLFAEYITVSALGVLAPYLALFIGNIYAATASSARGARRSVPTTPPASASRSARISPRPPARTRGAPARLPAIVAAGVAKPSAARAGSSPQLRPTAPPARPIAASSSPGPPAPATPAEPEVLGA